MSEVIFWGGVLRFVQSLAQAAPTLLVGLLVAGVFRRFLGHEHTRRLFGASTWGSLPQAWAMGMLLPVCSLGVIPVLREMRRAGLSGGTILAFAIAAPLFNPLSLLYGLTLSEPMTILAFAVCSLMVVTAVGLIFDRMFPGTERIEPSPPQVAYGLKRMTSIVVVAARELAGPTSLYLVIGLLGTAVVSAVIPAGSLQTTVNHGNPWAPPLMAAVAIPAYVTPMLAISQLGSMFQHGNSVGAAFVLLTLGAGVNLGLLAWTVKSYGLLRSGLWFASVVSVVLGIAYAIENPLYPKNIEAADHTHAFDTYTSPFHPGAVSVAQTVQLRLNKDVLPHERWCLIALGGLLACGVALRLLDSRWRVEDWLESRAAITGHSGEWYHRHVPGPVLGGAAIVGLVAVSVIGCYMYYPPPEVSFEEMRVPRVEALAAAIRGERKQAEHWIAEWDDWTRRTQVGVYLRNGGLTDFQRIKARILRDKLELLEHELYHDDRAEMRRLVTATEMAYRRMRRAYLGDEL